jgi:uncharacterized membrane protein YgcG
MSKDVDRGRRRRIAAAAAAAIATVVAFASLGGVGMAHGRINLAQYQYGKKITICHKGKNTITISQAAWPAHQRHGDTQGACTNGHKKNNGKHKGETNHAPNPATDTGQGGTTTTQSSSSTDGQSGNHGNNGQSGDHGHGGQSGGHGAHGA